MARRTVSLVSPVGDRPHAYPTLPYLSLFFPITHVRRNNNVDMELMILYVAIISADEHVLPRESVTSQISPEMPIPRAPGGARMYHFPRNYMSVNWTTD